MRKFKKYLYPVDSNIWFEIIPIIAFAILVFFIGSMPTNATEKEEADKSTYIDSEYVDYCFELGNEYGISPAILISIIEVESSGRSYVVNDAGYPCYGLCQINANTWRDRMNELGIDNIYDPYSNIKMCCEILTHYRNQYGSNGEPYGSDIGWVLMKYNGFSKADYYIENGMLSSYANRILERSRELEDFYYGKDLVGQV